MLLDGHFLYVEALLASLSVAERLTACRFNPEDASVEIGLPKPADLSNRVGGEAHRLATPAGAIKTLADVCHDVDLER